jgi:hypothetical protein
MMDLVSDVRLLNAITQSGTGLTWPGSAGCQSGFTLVRLSVSSAGKTKGRPDTRRPFAKSFREGRPTGIEQAAD